MGDRTRGLYAKFSVKRIDGKDGPKSKHRACEYFVLDLSHDPHAVAAIKAYIESARGDGYDFLCDDLSVIIEEVEYRRLRERKESRGDKGLDKSVD